MTMEGFVRVGVLADFEPGVLRAVQVGGLPVAVVNVSGELHALSDFCPHEGIALSAGYGVVYDRTVMCMMHTSLFDIASGDVFSGPADEGLTKYAVKVEGGEVFVSSQARI